MNAVRLPNTLRVVASERRLARGSDDASYVVITLEDDEDAAQPSFRLALTDGVSSDRYPLGSRFRLVLESIAR
jgi:hypothetical protein